MLSPHSRARGSVRGALLAAALASAWGAAAALPPAASDALPFIEDDFPRALIEAKSRKLPIFIDAWAPW